MQNLAKLLMFTVLLSVLPTDLLAQEGGCAPCKTTLSLCGTCHHHDSGKDHENEQNHEGGITFPLSCNGQHGPWENCVDTQEDLEEAAEELDALLADGAFAAISARLAANDGFPASLQFDQGGILLQTKCPYTEQPLTLLVPADVMDLYKLAGVL